MTREIKFRAWDKDNKLMILFDLFSTLLSTYPMGLEVMQYTGLKDKNGKEIYESDLLSDSHECFMECKWNEFSAMFMLMNTGIGSSLSMGFAGQFEVIGNIYENQELLK
jgi:hypothetical protein